MNITIAKKTTFSLESVQILLAEYCFLSILYLYPYFATVSILLGVPSRPISFAYRVGYLLMAVTVIAIELYAMEKRESKISKYSFLFVWFWLVYLGRMYYDLVFLGLIDGYARSGFVYFFQYGILGSFVPAVAFILVSKRMNYKRLFRVLRLGCLPLIFCLVYIVDHEFGFNAQLFASRISLGDEEHILSPIAISQYGGIVAVVGFFHIVYDKMNWLDLLLIVLGIVMLVVGASRGPLLSVLFTIVLIVFQKVKSRIHSLKIWRNVFFSFILLFSVFTIYIVPVMDKISLFNRVEQSVNSGKGLDARGLTWDSAWNQFLESPIFGDRIIERVYNFYPHNLILEILMSTGLIGGLAMLILFMKVGKTYYYSKSIYIDAVLLLFCLNFMFTMFSGSIIASPKFWCLLALSFTLPTLQINKNV